MITNKGKELIARYVAGKSAVWAGAIEFGVGQTAAAATDTELEFPFVRVPVDYMDYDPSTYVIKVRAVLPQEVTGTFHEVGVFSSEEYPAGEEGNLLILDYSGEDTVYAGNNTSVVAENAKVGDTATKLTAPAAGTADVRGFINIRNLEEYSDNDNFSLAYFYTDTGGTPTINVRFESSPTDYFEGSFTPAAGYNIEEIVRSGLTQTGAPSWDTINAVYVETTDQSDVTLDGLIIKDTINIASYGMIARQVISPELVKNTGIETDAVFEITLGF